MEHEVLAIGGLALSSLLMLLGLRFRVPSLVLFGRQTLALHAPSAVLCFSPEIGSSCVASARVSKISQVG